MKNTLGHGKFPPEYMTSQDYPNMIYQYEFRHCSMNFKMRRYVRKYKANSLSVSLKCVPFSKSEMC